eukprot:GFYU01010596.1.p1 GENE.GFYU01010596.1~~GFYU01010596.1.p1  ORF type:complete len:540 (-),score=218.72 GFYU01010596.1:64-1683(-)
MSNLNKIETTEPNVIDDSMIAACIAKTIRKVVTDQQKDVGAPVVSAEVVDTKQEDEVVEIHEAEAVMFSFNNIFKIENLVGFTNLKKLQLDNNVIEKIENIGHIVTLEWLDLSFNNIEKIENLETLTRLTDLSLFNNRISKIENLDTLTNLNVLSIGNNHLKDHEDLKYLRRFKSLRLVNLAGNPLCKVPDPDYRTYVLAYVPQLRYLDYRLIDEGQRSQARETHQEDILALEEEEGRDAAIAEQKVIKEAEQQKIRDANLEGVESMFDDMMKEDVEMPKFSSLACVDGPVQEYQAKFVETVEPVKDFILEQMARKQGEEAAFRKAVGEVKKRNDVESMNLISQFELFKKQVLANAKQNEYNNQEMYASLKEAIQVLNDSLMELELNQVDTFEEMNLEFEKQYGEIVGQNVERIQQFFGMMRELQSSYNESLSSKINAEIEAVNEDPESVDEDSRALLMDKDILTAAVSASHDNHISKVDARDDEVTTAENAAFTSLMATIRRDESQRNRNRVDEIYLYINRNTVELEMLQEQEAADRD